MHMSIEELDERIEELRARFRQARQSGDVALARELRAQLAEVEAAWQAAADAQSVPPAPSLVPFREQVHHALTLLTVPAAPRLIAAVHAAFLGGDLPASRFTSLRRDEERSFLSAQYGRPYYLCPALTTDRLGPVRGLLSISTWPLVDRLVGPLSPRVHFLTSAIKVAEAVARAEQPRPAARRLLMRFAANIPGATDGGGTPEGIARAARNELVIHEESDRATREAAAARASRLPETQRLFGVKLAAVVREDAG